MLQHLVRGFSEENPYSIGWLDAPFNGQGAFVWPDGSRYEGEWLDGIPSGRGKYVWSDGCCYEGEWRQGLPEGKGEYIHPDGTRHQTEWQGGRPKSVIETNELPARLRSTVQKQQKTIAELQQQLAAQISSAQKTDTSAVKDAEVRYKALESEKTAAEKKIKLLEKQAEKLTAELKSTLENNQKILADLQQQLAAQTSAAQRSEAAIAAVEDRCRILETGKLQAEEKVNTLEQQAEALGSELKNAVKTHQKSITKLQQQLDLQISAVQKAEAAAAAAEGRNKALEAEKLLEEERIRTLEQQEKIHAVRLEAALESSRKDLADLHQKLSLQTEAVLKAEAAVTDMEGRCRILESEKLQAEEQANALKQQLEALTAELNSTVQNQQKAVSKLQQQLDLQRAVSQKTEADSLKDAEVRYKALEAEKTAAENKIKSLQQQAEILAVELDSTLESNLKTIANLQQQLTEQNEAAQKAAADAAAHADSQYKTLEEEKSSLEEEVKTLKRQAERLAIELESTLENDRKKLADLQLQLSVQSKAARKAESDAAALEDRCRTLESNKTAAESKVGILEGQIEALAAERDTVVKDQQKSLSELKQQLALQITAVEKAEALAAADADARYRALEAEKIRVEKHVKILEQQAESRSAKLNRTIEDQQQTIAELQRQFDLQIEAALHAASAAAADAEERYEVLGAEKTAVEEKLSKLEQKAEAGKTRLSNTVKNQKKQIADLKKQLASQISAAQKTEEAAAEAEERYGILEAEKISTEEQLRTFEQQTEIDMAKLKSIIDNQKKTITELARQLAEADGKSRSPQQPSFAATAPVHSKGQWSKIFEDGRSYLGELNDDRPEGLGVMVFPDGGQYVGEWSAGERHGRGTQTFADGSSYAGQWERDVMSGEGILIEPEVRSYMGTWKNNFSEGKGIEIFPDGKRYEGEFKRGRYEGQGTLTLANGTKYTGEFKNSLSNGKGVLKYPNGDRYEGEFRNNKYHGQGTLTLIDGRKYTGELEKGLPHGQGIMILADGRKYIGEFRNGQFVDKKISNRGG